MRTLLLPLFACTLWAQAPAVRPGVWAGAELKELPVAASGYQVYMLGEMHGAAVNQAVLEQYLAMLHEGAGLRDVAIEEDAVYQSAAEAYVEGRDKRLPAELCLRANVLDLLRRFNQGRPANQRVRVHLVDIDSPPAAILQHLAAVKERIPEAKNVRLPEAAAVEEGGMKAAEKLRRLAKDERDIAALRTIRFSLRALEQGFEAGTGPSKGSPYLEDREDAIAANVRDIVKLPGAKGVLVFYGADHVSRTRRADGGEKRDQGFAPLALRLEMAGLKIYSAILMPLSGSVQWRGKRHDIVWTAADGALDNGETLEKLVGAYPAARLFLVDPKLQRVRLPSSDITGYLVDVFLLAPSTEPMQDACRRRGPA